MEKSVAKHIVNYLKENQESMILFLKKLVEAESPSRDANSQVKIIGLLKSALEELDFLCDTNTRKDYRRIYIGKTNYKIKEKSDSTFNRAL